MYTAASKPLGGKASYLKQIECRTQADCGDPKKCFCDSFSGLCYCNRKLFKTNTDQKMNYYKGDQN